MTTSQVYLGIFEGHYDPAVAVVRDGHVVAYSEEERHLRYKHAPAVYPIRALRYCLEQAGASISDVAAVATNWNLAAYSDGTMQAFFETVREAWPVDPQTLAWQGSLLRRFNADSQQAFHERHWRRAFGDVTFPRLYGVPHHYAHAFHAAMQSPFEQAVCLSIDGSGDQHTTVVWHKNGAELSPIHETFIPHSLGWVYAAITEYLGFQAYDGEYKVMGLAAYGRRDVGLDAKVSQLIRVAADGIGFEVDPTLIHFGNHSYSDRYTDALVDLFGRPPRLPSDEIVGWHEDLAFAVQDGLERAVERLVLWGAKQLALRNVCVGGGVGLNVKMNSRLFNNPEIDDVFAQPLCSDGGAAVGAALVACYESTGAYPEKLETLALGPEDTMEHIESTLRMAHLDYERPDDVCAVVANELAQGKIVGWFQGRMEAGPRALGQRSILADPRRIENRDRVNAIVKFREYWRPFCPSMVAEAADRYFDKYTNAPFMIVAFDANDRLRQDAPAIVHVDGTSRVQLVHAHVLPRYHRLISEFGRLTGVPVLLNTSFNVKGEPIVCTVHDALRTFWATGLEVLAVGDFVIRKPVLNQ